MADHLVGTRDELQESEASWASAFCIDNASPEKSCFVDDLVCVIQNALMVLKSLNGLVPKYLTSKFIKRNESSYSLRNSVNKLVVPFPRTNYMKNSFSYSGATLWNSLPCNIRESPSLP